MAVTTLGKLQNIAMKQEKEIIELKDLLAKKTETLKCLQIKYDYLENNIENKIKRVLEDYSKEVNIEIDALKKENQSLRNMLNKDSNNSGIPTSKTPIGKEKRISNSREQSDKLIGGQEGHIKHQLKKFNDNEITDSYLHEIKKCTCGGNLQVIDFKIKDEFDIDLRVQKIRHYFNKYECVCCHKLMEVPIPKELKEENQYGNNVKALAISLVNEGCVSFNRTRSLIKGFTGNEIDMSEGLLVKLQKNCFLGLDKFINDLKMKVLTEKVIHWDDTVIMINTKRSCLRFYGTDNLSLFTAHEKKDKVGIEEDEILPLLQKDTVVMHDHNTVNYNSNYNFQNAECCVHLIRDLKSLNEILNRKWIQQMSELLLNTNKERKKYLETGILHFEDAFIDDVNELYDHILLEAKVENENNYDKYNDKEEKALINRLTKYKNNYLMWIIRFDIPFSNNLSERNLRSSKTKMKVSGQFKNIVNAQYYATIKSYIETCKRNGLNEHIAIVKLLDNNPYTVAEILSNKNSD